METEITAAKIRAMTEGDILTQVCKDTLDLESTYQAAIQIKNKIPDREIKVSKSGVTMTVTVRRIA